MARFFQAFLLLKLKKVTIIYFLLPFFCPVWLLSFFLPPTRASRNMESKPEHGTNLWPSNFHNLNPEQQIYYATSLSKQSNYLKKKPFAHTTGDIKKLVQRFVTPGTKISGEFSWALSFDPSFIARLANELLY